MKYLCLFIVLLYIAGCKKTEKGKEQDVIRVSVLKGPSAIAFAQCLEFPPVVNGKAVSITIADSPDIIQASLIKGEADIAVLPMISAANLYNKGIRYPLLGCPLWGTLYLIGKNFPSSKNELYLFGTGTTPDILTRYYLDRKRLTYSMNYSFSTAPEVLQALLAGKAEMVVLSEPFVSMALRKDTTLRIIGDLNNPEGLSPEFPQTAIVCNILLSEDASQLDSILRASCQFAVEHPVEAIRILEERHVFAPGMLTPECIERCKIYYQTAKEAQQSIDSFLRLIEQYEPKALGGRLPDSSFISKRE
ncbi:ABC transporter substrate-binding protein [Parabacteroides chinchillae]|uniref:NitT/TauT family transport system substrate-binding protein n=1 Tax=Parabacteroides chinchillae TaxID=871327 RepID=A0A8G2BUV8_9BACT|nr:ABC transporter substrate-binding protein [Parabacteroides chinchillae]SEF53782.1 NitT/TauT family transport system substrate-binding protein [Parabacteroides chinchillae]